jgi:hypothetical protein
VTTYTLVYDTKPSNERNLIEGGLYHALVSCDNVDCGKVTLLIFEGVRKSYSSVHGTVYYIGTKLMDQYPKKIPKLHESIPSDVADDYVEAIKCFDVGAWKASSVMCRRSLQESVIEKGAKKDKLIDQIDELCDQEIITKDIKDWAQEIRLTGNIGAHPDKDGLEDVTEDDAKELINFMEEYLNYVYILPSKVVAKRARK